MTNLPFDPEVVIQVGAVSQCAIKILVTLSTTYEKPDFDPMRMLEADFMIWRAGITGLKRMLPSENYFISTRNLDEKPVSTQLRLINAILLLDIFFSPTWRLSHPWLALRVPVADCPPTNLPDNLEVIEFQRLMSEVKENYLALCSSRNKSDVIWCICHVILNICSTCIALCEFVSPQDTHEWAKILSSDFIMIPDFVTGPDAVFEDEAHRSLCETRWTSRALERIRQFKSRPETMARFSWEALQTDILADILQVIVPSILLTQGQVDQRLATIHQHEGQSSVSTLTPEIPGDFHVANPSSHLSPSDQGVDDIFGPDIHPEGGIDVIPPSAKSLGKRKAESSTSYPRLSKRAIEHLNSQPPDDHHLLEQAAPPVDEQQIRQILEGLREVGALSASIDPSHPSPDVFNAVKSSLLSPNRTTPLSPPPSRKRLRPNEGEPSSSVDQGNTSAGVKPERQKVKENGKRVNVYATGRNQTGRIKWTPEEDRCLREAMKELYSDGKKLAVWSTIMSWHGEGGLRSNKLMQRNPVALKDRARNIVLKIKAQRQAVPDYLSWVKVPDKK